MFRLMFALLAFLWSAVLDGTGGGSGEGGSGEGGSGGGGGGADGGFTLTEAELTQRTAAAAQAETKRIADLLGIDPDKIGDAKGLIEAGRARQNADNGGQGGGQNGGQNNEGSGEGGNIKDQIAELLKPFTDRLGQIEQTEQQRQQAQAEQTRDELLDAALKEANVRDERLETARTIALASGAKLNDKGELTGSKEAIAAAKKALPEAFRGDGDVPTAADAGGREKTERKPQTLQEAVAAHFSKS